MSSSYENSCDNSGSSYNCVSIDMIAEFSPNTIANTLSSISQTSCYLTPSGYCDNNGCYTANSSTAKLNCNCLTLLANINLGIYNSMSCAFNQASVLNENFLTSWQIINFTLYSPGNINNSTVNTSQISNQSLKTISLSNITNQNKLGNLSYQSIQSILNQASSDPSLFNDSLSQQLIYYFNQYNSVSTNDLNTNVVNNTVNIIKSMIENINVQTNYINIVINDSQYSSLNVDLSQSNILSILSECIANNVTTSTISSVLKSFNISLDTVMQSCYTSSNDQSYSPSIINKSSKTKIIIIIIVIILIFIFLIVFLIKNFIKKKTVS